MKDNSLRLFCINFLVSTLFCFPVFSAEFSSRLLIKKEFNNSHNELCINEISDYEDKKRKKYSILKQLIKKVLSHKNIDVNKSVKHFQEHSHPRYFLQWVEDLILIQANIFSFPFIDISYLKELRTIKMLS